MNYPSIRIEGAILSPDILDGLYDDTIGQRPADFGLASGTKVKDEIARAWADAQTYFKNHRHMMAYAEHIEKNLPIGSGVTEAACKTLVKQRLCGSGMRWKDKGAKVILSLRALVQTQGRWQQFWDKIDQFGSQVYA